MKAVIFQGTKKLGQLGQYHQQQVKARIAKLGGNPELVPQRLINAIEINGFTIKPVYEERPAIPESQYHQLESTEDTPTRVIEHYKGVDYSPEALRKIKRQQLSQQHERYDAERFDYQGLLIKGDLEARINALGYIDLFTANAIEHVRWVGKVAQGDALHSPLAPAELVITSLDEMKDLATAISAYLLKGRVAKEAVTDALEAANDLQAVADVDVNTLFNNRIAA